MARKRKTAADRRAEWSAAEGRAWSEFKAKIEAAWTIVQALTLALDFHRPHRADDADRQCYANLRFFLDEGFKEPEGLSFEERALYRDLLRRVLATGDPHPRDREKAERYLSESQ